MLANGTTSSNHQTVTVTVPATTANLGPGFDCLGLALELRNIVTLDGGARTLPFDSSLETRVEVHVKGLDAEKIPLDRNNLLLTAANSIFMIAGRRPAELLVKMHNHIPVGSGLGSSSSAIVAGLLGANALMDAHLSQDQILEMAVEMEGHPDNVAPALLGGLVLGILSDPQMGPDRLLVRQLPPPDLKAVIVLPDILLSTSEARAVLPAKIDRSQAIFNASRFGLLLTSLLMKDYSQLAVAMADRLHQPYRLPLIPGADEAIIGAYDAGALGVALSGAGPSLIAFSSTATEKIAQAMISAFRTAGLNCRYWILDVAKTGATCIPSPQKSHNLTK